MLYTLLHTRPGDSCGVEAACVVHFEVSLHDVSLSLPGSLFRTEQILRVHLVVDSLVARDAEQRK